MKNTRRNFIRKTALAAAATYAGNYALRASSYNRIKGANDRVNVGVIGFSDRHRESHAPAFLAANKDLNFDIIAVSDIWKKRREEGVAFWKEKLLHDITPCMNNEALYDIKQVDAVFISTSDFQHALHAIEAVKAGRDAYVEKPLAETMDDAKAVLKAIKESNKNCANRFATKKWCQLYGCKRFYTKREVWPNCNGRTYMERKPARPLEKTCTCSAGKRRRCGLEKIFTQQAL